MSLVMIMALGIIVIALALLRHRRAAFFTGIIVAIIMSLNKHAESTKETEEPAAKAVAEAAKNAAERAAAEAKAKDEATKAFISSTPEAALKLASPSDEISLRDDIWATTYYRLQRIAMQHVAWAEVASSEGRCSSAFKINPEAVRKNLLVGGLSDSLTLDRSNLRRKYAEYHQSNPNIFCNFAREQFGPNGKKEHALRADVGPLIDIIREPSN
jgi:hypothetical protein